MGTNQDWEDYWDVGGLTQSDMASASAELGLIFPPDFVSLMTQHQGQIPPRRWVKVFQGPKTKFGPIMHFRKGRGGEVVTTRETFMRHGYPKELVPFADSGSQTHWALDYRASRERPKVCLVVPELGYDDADSVVEVADSVTDLLSMLESAE